VFHAVNAVTNTYSANVLNQYTSVNATTLSYDADGNLLSDGGRVYSWDAENRLRSVTPANATNGSLKVVNRYDHMHRRVTKKVYALSGCTPPYGEPPMPGDPGEWGLVREHTYFYDGWNLVLETVAHADGSVDRIEYVWGLDISGTLQGAGGVGGLLFEVRNGQIFIPFYDANGNVTAYVDAHGNVRGQYIYDVFGNTVSQTGDMADVFHFRFSTKYWDEETRSYYYGYRHYAPKLGCWLNRDPIGVRGGRNLHGFVRNDPINKWDYLGLNDGQRTPTLWWNNFINIISKRAKYKNQWYKTFTGNPYTYQSLSPPETLHRKSGCGRLYAIEYEIEPASGRSAFNTRDDSDNPYRLWEGTQIKTNIGPPRNEFRYTVEVSFAGIGKKPSVNRLWTLLPNMDGKWTWDTIASKTVTEPISAGDVSVTVTVQIRLLTDNRIGMDGVNDNDDVYVVSEDKYEIKD
jgi:RHS repeat-associated protein